MKISFFSFQFPRRHEIAITEILTHLKLIPVIHYTDLC